MSNLNFFIVTAWIVHVAAWFLIAFQVEEIEAPVVGWKAFRLAACEPAVVRQELAAHIDSITLLPEGKGEISYKGSWKVVGESGGAEGQS